MRYFIDTEFHEEPGSLELISIGIAAEDGRTYYAESIAYNPARATDWLKANVLPHLEGGAARKHPHEIRDEILAFVGDDRNVQFWGYFAAYDWVLFCGLFGRMIDLPKHFPMWIRDVMQWSEMKGIRRESWPKQMNTAHNALDDALWTTAVFKYLTLVK